jgi:hypothetical protein
LRLKNIEINQRLKSNVIERNCPSFSGQVEDIRQKFNSLKMSIDKRTQDKESKESIAIVNDMKQVYEKMHNSKCVIIRSVWEISQKRKTPQGTAPYIKRETSS